MRWIDPQLQGCQEVEEGAVEGFGLLERGEVSGLGNDLQACPWNACGDLSGAVNGLGSVFLTDHDRRHHGPEGPQADEMAAQGPCCM